MQLKVLINMSVVLMNFHFQTFNVPGFCLTGCLFTTCLIVSFLLPDPLIPAAESNVIVTDGTYDQATYIFTFYVCIFIQVANNKMELCWSYWCDSIKTVCPEWSNQHLRPSGRG